MFEQEIWKDIKGYEKIYQISNLGRVKTLKRFVPNGNKSFREIKEKILKCGITTNGYSFVILCKNNKTKAIRIHRLVAETFLSNPHNFAEINHKDENKLNNCANNLEWCTRKYNMKYGNCLEKMGKSHRKKVNQYDLKGNYIKTFNYINEAQKESGANASSIIKCCKGEQKKSKGYMWKYFDNN